MTAASIEGEFAGPIGAAQSDMKPHRYVDAMSGHAVG